MVDRTPVIRMRVTVRGRVQGIGFRWFVRETAERMGVGGWVRNCAGGEVQAEVQGEEETLTRFIAEIRTRHPYARVDSVETSIIAAAPVGAAFEIR